MTIQKKKTLDVIDKNIEQAIPIVATAYAEQFGIQISVGGTEAFTNGELINLPLLDTDKVDLGVYWGYLAHEAAHCRFTNFGTRKPDGALGCLFNIIEDVRIEMLFEESFPGTKIDLDAVMDNAEIEGCFIPNSNVDPVSTLLGYLLVRLNAQYLNRQSCSKYVHDHETLAKKCLPNGFFIRLDSLLAKYMAPLSTKDCLKLSQLILAALQESEEEENQQKPSQSNNGNGDSEGEDLDDENCLNDQSSKPNPVESETSSTKCFESDATLNACEETKSSSASKSGSKILDSFDENNAPISPSDAAKQKIEQSAQHMRAVERPDVTTLNEYLMEDGNIDDFISTAMTRSSSLRHRLLALIQARDRSRRYLARTGKKAQSSKLASVSTGNTRVFRQQEIKEAPKSAVHVLVDNSGSMSGEAQNIANQATAAISLALNSLPSTSVAVSAFPGIGGHVTKIIERGSNLNQTLGNCHIRSTGGTPLAEAQLFCLTELSRCSEDRKIFFVITDGDANNKPAVKHLNSHNDILSLGLIIGRSDCLQGMFDYTAVISDIGDLQNKVFEIIEQVI